MGVSVGQTCLSNWWVTITYYDRSALGHFAQRLFRWAKRWSWLLLVIGWCWNPTHNTSVPQKSILRGLYVWNLELGMIMKSILFPQSKFAAPNVPAFFLHFDIDLRPFLNISYSKLFFSVWRCQKTGEWVTDQSTFTKRSPHPKNKKEVLRKMNVDVSGSWGVPISSKIFLQDG